MMDTGAVVFCCMYYVHSEVIFAHRSSCGVWQYSCWRSCKMKVQIHSTMIKTAAYLGVTTTASTAPAMVASTRNIASRRRYIFLTGLRASILPQIDCSDGPAANYESSHSWIGSVAFCVSWWWKLPSGGAPSPSSLPAHFAAK